MNSEEQPGSPHRPHSIDLTLELERELDNESLPPTSPQASNRPQSLDSSVLASIVTQLRFSLDEVTKERDALVHLLEQSTSKHADLQDSLHFATDRATSLEEKLSVAHDKHKEDEEAISMLRTKVEESRLVTTFANFEPKLNFCRRGLMRLQTESRRVSQLVIDPSRTAPAAKRMSLITPLPPPTPNRGHKRFSSQSDASFSLHDASELSQLPSPISEAPGSPAPNSRRFSMLTRTVSSPPLDQDIGLLAKEFEGLKKELKNTRDELEETRHELTEANEARDASEQCAKALRDYISENAVGESGASAPPPARPSLLVPPAAKVEDPKSASKWSFKLWNGASSPNTAAPPPAPSRPSLSSFTSPQVPAVSPPLLTKTLGSLFGTGRGSISSISSTSSQPASAPSPPGLPSMYRGESDASSAGESEPRSPDLDSVTEVMVRETSTSSELSGMGGSIAEPNTKTRPDELAVTPTATTATATAF